MKHFCQCLTFLALVFITLTVQAKDLGFRYVNGQCVNSAGQVGLNPGHFGQCSDLRNVILGRIDFSDIDFSGSQFTNADLQQSRFSNANLTGTSFEAANLSGVKMDNAILHSVDMKNAVLKNTQLSQANIKNCDFSNTDMAGIDMSLVKIESSIFKNTVLTGANFEAADLTGGQLQNADLSRANLKSAILTRADLSAAILNDADLTGANLQSATAIGTALKNTTLTEANLQEADFSSADLRRAKLINAQLASANLQKTNLVNTNLTDAKYNVRTNFSAALYSNKTILPFSSEKANQLGLILKAGISNILIIWDVQNEQLTSLAATIEAAGFSVTLSPVSETQYVGQGLADADAVLHLNGTTYGAEMPLVAQQALVQFVRDGGTFIGTAWSGYEIGQGRMQAMKDLNLITYNNGSGALQPIDFKVDAGQESHDIFDGLSATFTISSCYLTVGTVVAFIQSPATSLAKFNNTAIAVATRELGEGKVIDLAIAGNYESTNCLKDNYVQKLIINTLNWD